MILLIDNYDSFTYNLFQYISELGKEVQVVRNDEITVNEIKERRPEVIILSPGPGTPDEAGICIEVVQKLGDTLPILGICLGHQAIGAAFGGNIIQAKMIKHGKTSKLKYNDNQIFKRLDHPLEVMRYHSLVIEKETIPSELEILATSEEDDEIMAVKHKQLPIYGLQFHPESIGTKVGKQILQNYFTFVKEATIVH
ncbi:aminodeoxychorismate/anthranilate synthase component II [Aquibacillus sp. 3ASR75-11]|uniref:Aminodeoxychorismate/anthranilate synthase component II n=1 Tax=Terrihalobacillus insolitus TaxID=2950438 RepID=A0A9X4AMT0_9BACI|nr:aminodeoxychorismate/anthranilate synthase component II [Terrihalobacillus insolitus]MDC3425651.1 aminodeoxychorismate/anthranilate synthase component II [Terrihalobacillus insolitus]